MEITVYADIYLFINFIFDLGLLFFTAKITHTPFKSWRLIISAALGGLYSLFCLGVTSRLLLHIAAALIMCLTALGRKGLLKNSVTLILTAMLSGGAVYGFFYMLGKGEADMLSLRAETLIICLLIALTLAFGYMYVCRKNSKTGAVNVRITFRGKEYKAYLLTDSGNMLTDPITLEPVAVISKKIFGEGFTDGDFPLRILPVKTAAGSDILYGFKPEKCEIRQFGSKKTRNVSIVVALSEPDRFNGIYDGLMPPI